MANPLFCPSCGAKVAPDSENCFNCPMSFRGAEHGVMDYRQRRGRDFSGPLVFFVVLGGLGYAGWTTLGRVMDEGAKQIQDERKLPPQQSRLPPPPAMPKKEDEEAEEAPQIEVKRVTQRQGRAAKSKRIARGGKERADEYSWLLRGKVYDLVTLKPISGITLVLKDIELNRRLEAVTNDAGGYRVMAPRLPGRGYTVVFDHPGYAGTSFLDPGGERMDVKPESERRQLAQELLRSVMPPQTLQGLDDTPLVTNFYLAPRDLR